MQVLKTRCDGCKKVYNNNPDSPKYMRLWSRLRLWDGSEWDICTPCQEKIGFHVEEG
jgi:hypothetical protein